MSRDKELSDRPSSTEGSANASHRLMASAPPRNAGGGGGGEAGDTAHPSAPRAAPAEGALRKSRIPSSKLLAVGEPGEKGSADVGVEVVEGEDDMVVTARLSSAGLAYGGMDEALRSSGVGLMETKIRYSSKSKEAAKMRKSRGRGGPRGSSLSATRPVSGSGKAPEMAEAAGPSSLSATKAVSGSDKVPEVAKATGSAAGQMVGSRSRGAPGGVLESKMALKNGGRSTANTPLSLDTGLDRQEVATPDAMADSSFDEEEQVKPGAVAIFPSDVTPSECDVESLSHGGHDEQGLYGGGEIMAEAHLVEEDDGDDDSGTHKETTTEYGQGGQEPNANDGADNLPPGVAVATAKRMSPLVRFAQDHCILVAALALLIVGGMAGMGAYLATRNTTTSCDGENCDGGNAFEEGGGGATTSPHRPTAAPTFSLVPSVSLAPSGAPSQSPTQAPTMPCDMSPVDRAEAISEFVASLVVDPLALADAASAHSLARRWLAEEDALEPPLCPDRDGSRLQQRFGLALLHYALGGDGGADSGGRGWTYKSFEYQFLHTDHECDWAGIDCNFGTKKVNEINLGGRNLRGTLPAELFTIFEDLRVLNLQVNRIHGCLPDKVSMASSLEFLFLSDNEFACELPRSFPTVLRELELLDNDFVGPIPEPMLAGLDSLQTLILGKNALTGAVPTEIGSLQELRMLHLDRNKLNSSLPLELFHLSNLISLRLNGNSFESNLSSSIAQLSRLEELYIHGNAFAGSIPSEIFSLGAIKTMALSQNSFSGALPEDVGAATTLEVLRLDDNRFTGTLPSNVSQLTKLELLSIQGNRFSGFIDNGICALLKENSMGEYTGNLRRLSADCRERPSDSGVICNCCDCTQPEAEDGYAFFCSPFGGEQFAIIIDNGDPAVSRQNEIIELIIQQGVSDRSALMQPSSPQGMAASWIINEDELRLASSDTFLLQRYSIAVLYFSTKGDSWAQCSATNGSPCDNGAAFLSNTSVCEWGGISCSSDGELYSIRLEYYGLEGTIPTKELSGLCLLTLSFRGNTGISIDLSSEHSAAIFSDLLKLDLSECDLVGQLNKYMFRPLFNVFLNDNRLNGTIPGGISYGENVRLQYNEISGTLPVELGRISGRELRLDNNILHGTIPTSFSSLRNLEILTLHNNELSGEVPDALCDLTFDYGGKLEDLWADCAEGSEVEVECSCCSQCL